MARRRIFPVASPIPEDPASDSDLPDNTTGAVSDLPMPIIRPYVAPYSPQFRQQAVVLARSRTVPVTQVARDLGISTDTLRDWIAQARHDRHQSREGTLSESVQAELMRPRTDNHRLQREVAILRDALAIVAAEGIAGDRGGR